MFVLCFVMVEHTVNFNVTKYSSRNELRSQVINKFIEEIAGTGKGELTSKYKYNVEVLSNGDKVYLTRPVPLNKGFDFVIHVENHIFSNNKDNPKHSDIIEDLTNKKNQEPNKFNILIGLINKVGECIDPSDLMQNEQLPKFDQGLTTEILLKVIKWLFIEQDIRYWNWSGRNMFLNGINELKES